MKKIEFQAGPVSCSVNPLSFDDALCIWLQPVRVRVPGGYHGSFPGTGKTSCCAVSGRMLLLRLLRHGLPGQGGHTSEASADEPDQVCGD